MSSFIPDYPWEIKNQKYPNIFVRLETSNFGVIHLFTFRYLVEGEQHDTSMEGECLTIDYIPDHIKQLQGKLRI